MKQYQIEINGQIIDASEYQNAIYDKIEYDTCNIIVNAAAGAAKTTTMVNALRLPIFGDGKKKVLFIAFNKSIVEAIEAKVKDRENITIRTFHSLGYQMIRNCFPDKKIQINENKYLIYINTNYAKFINPQKLTNRSKKLIFKKNIEKLVDYCRYYVAVTNADYKKIAEKYGINPLDNEFEAVKEILKWGKENIDTIDYTDMIYLPAALNLRSRALRYDYIFIDEAQDTSIAEQMLVESTFKRNTRFVCVCDIHQQINVWCGATENAIENFRNLNKKRCEDLRLPISYRCPILVVRYAKQYSDNIEAAPNAEKGVIREKVSIYEPKNGDMVLSRTTAPIVDLYLKYLRVNKPCYIKGSEGEKEMLVGLIKSTKATILDKKCNGKDGLFPRLYQQLFEIIKSNMNTYKIDEEEAIRYSNVLQFYDTIETISVLCEGMPTVQDLIDKIESVFVENNQKGVELSTIHKAKGLEADNVFIIPSSLPDILGNKSLPWEKETERNLKYVACTRAKKSLNFLDNRDLNLFKTASLKEMKFFLKIIKDRIDFAEEHDISSIDETDTTTIKTLGNITTKQNTNNRGIRKLSGFLKI